jgi:hypothetical protein
MKRASVSSTDLQGGRKRRLDIRELLDCSFLVCGVADNRDLYPLLRERQIQGFECIISPPACCPGRQGAFSGSCPASVAELAHAARHLNQHNRCGRHCEIVNKTVTPIEAEYRSRLPGDHAINYFATQKDHVLEVV